MKNILLTISLSLATFFSVLAYLDKNEGVEMQQTLPTVEIKAKKIQENIPELTLPEVTIRAKRIRVATVQLPEALIVAQKEQKSLAFSKFSASK